MKEIYEIADDVVAFLNAAAFNVAMGPLGANLFTAFRAYVPLDELVKLDTLVVQVFPFPTKDGLTLLTHDVDGMSEDITVSVGILQHFADGDFTTAAGNVKIDPLVQLARKIALMYTPGMNSAGQPRADTDPGWFETSFPLAYDSAMLKDKRTYLGVIQFKFKQ